MTHTAHKLPNGRWILAVWSSSHRQWQSSALKNQHAGYRYSYANSLRALAEIGVSTYTTRAGAIAARRRLGLD